MSLRYYAGYSFLILSHLLTKVLALMWRGVSLPQQFALIIWTPSEIDRYARNDWNSWPVIRYFSRMDDWLGVTEESLVETYFTKDGEPLNVACGAGREALLLARRGLRVIACDWSPRMIEEAQRRAREANLTVRFAVANLFDLPYPEKAFDYLLLTNIGYSYLFPRHRRVRFLRQAHAVLKPGGIFIISFTVDKSDSKAHRERLERLFIRLRRWSPFNMEYEPGDRFAGTTFTHFFRSEELAQEFQEAQFLVKDWLWEKGFAVLVKL